MDLFFKLNPAATYGGESTDPNHRGWIDILSYQLGWATTVSLSAGDPQVSAPNASEITMAFELSKATVAMFGALVRGTAFPSATLACRAVNGTASVDFYVLDFTDLFVTGLNLAGADGDANPSGSASFAYGTVVHKYRQKLASGYAPATPTGWDFLLQRPT